MPLTVKIAWRNILRHRGKSIIIGVILFLGALVMTVGNGVISGMEAGLEKNIIEGFTGDIVVISDKNENDNVLFTIMGKAIEPVNNFTSIKPVLDGLDSIDKFLPAGRNMALVLNEEGGSPGYAFLLGVDFEKYLEMFPHNMSPVEGRLMKEGERGALLPTGSRKEFYNQMGIWFVPTGGSFIEDNFRKETEEKEEIKDVLTKDSIVFLGFNEKNTAMDVRLDIKGAVKFRALNTIFGHYNIVDIESYRECLGYFSASSKTADVPEDKKQMLSLENIDIDMLFGDEEVMSSPQKAQTEVHRIGKDETKPAQELPVDIEEGTYNLVFVKLNKGVSKSAALDKINKALKDADLGVRAVSWKKAFGTIGSMTTIIKGALFVFVMLLFVVAIIIIVNTLTMSALERVSEIGMMRAIGARKGFISGMFLAETATLSVVFGGAGILAGIIAVNVIPMLGITTENDLLQLLYGGDTFQPLLSLPDIVTTMLQLALVTVIAVLYPLRVAKGITPLDAIVRD